MISRERTIVKLQVGHESEMFEQPLTNGHTFRWTVFIRPVAGSAASSFSKAFISKVKFILHDSYEQPIRIVREAPFQITETGYGSFSPNLEIYFNYPGAKPIKYAYDMMLQMAKRAESKEDINLELKDAPSNFAEIARGFGAKRKRSGTDGSTSADPLFPPLKLLKSNDGRSPRDSQKSTTDSQRSTESQNSKKENVRSGKDSKEKQSKDKDQKRSEKKREKQRDVEKKKESKDREKSVKKSPEMVKVRRETPSSSPTIRTVPQRPVKHAPSKTDEKRAAPTLQDSDISSPSTSYGSLTPRTPLSTQTTSSSSSPMTPAEMHKRMSQLTDGEQIFRVAAILIGLPGSNILPSRQVLNFDIDLNSADPTVIARLCEALS